MFITGEKHTGYFEENVYEDNLHGGPPAGMLMLVRIQSKYLQAGWGAESKKSYQREAAVTLRHFEADCTQSSLQIGIYRVE